MSELRPLSLFYFHTEYSFTSQLLDYPWSRRSTLPHPTPPPTPCICLLFCIGHGFRHFHSSPAFIGFCKLALSRSLPDEYKHMSLVGIESVFWWVKWGTPAHWTSPEGGMICVRRNNLEQSRRQDYYRTINNHLYPFSVDFSTYSTWFLSGSTAIHVLIIKNLLG